MNLKELIENCESIVEDKNKSGAIRGTYKKVLKDLKELDELTELKGVEIPQCAIDVIESAKEQGHSLSKAMDIMGKTMEFCHWIDLPTNQELFARAWIEGHEIEQEKRYLVKMKGVEDITGFLNFGGITKTWFMGDEINSYGCRTHHTRKELEEAGFGEVFNNSLFEIQGVNRK